MGSVDATERKNCYFSTSQVCAFTSVKLKGVAEPESGTEGWGEGGQGQGLNFFLYYDLKALKWIYSGTFGHPSLNS